MSEKIFIYTLDGEELLYSVNVAFPAKYYDVIDKHPRLANICRTVVIDGDPVKYERYSYGMWLKA